MCVHCSSILSDSPIKTCDEPSPYERMPCPEYHSATYYAVVIGTGIYKGWRASYVGLGKMKFIKTDDLTEYYHGTDTIAFHGGYDMDWMENCWNQFLVHLQVTDHE